MTYPWWYGAAASVSAHQQPEPDDEGGPIYPAHGPTRSAIQDSVYNQHYNPGSEWGSEQTVTPDHGTDEYAQRQAHHRLIAEIANYMMSKMEPTDRCLRPPGDIWYPPDWKHAREIDGKWVPYDGS